MCPLHRSVPWGRFYNNYSSKPNFFIPPIETFSLPSLRWAWIVSWHHVHVEHTQQNHDLQKRSFLHLNIPFFFLWKFARPCQGFWLAYSKYSVSKMKWLMVNHPMVVEYWRKWGRFGSFILFYYYYCAVQSLALFYKLNAWLRQG